ncbi:MAG: cupin domain-containing protein [Acidobacteria bacterium]|nr:cupin domain-containing protein [Acidobacteriota bacterium]
MRRFDVKRRATIEEAMIQLPGPQGELYVSVFEHGSLTVEVYVPHQTDLQTPHSRDEAYVVVQGSGEFVNEDQRMGFEPGDFLFAAAGETHRFENFSDDLVVWVLFYGPEGGENRQ